MDKKTTSERENDSGERRPTEGNLLIRRGRRILKDTKKILSRRKDENVVIQNNERMILNKDMEDTMLQRKDVLSREGGTRTRFKRRCQITVKITQISTI